ncbi:hypothetical protein diail_3447 [Diaporthe ilicicola]|nr:hypothetical protein diail_3447 [Diaporthe ilicicola]
MNSYRGRGGPRKPTPANVQCQKSRHYSYECKVQLQERPYNARPSRTQQLLNPKLVPKLTNDTPDDATRKKGVADEELARKEAERARKRELDEDDAAGGREPESKRQRSSSVDSVSSISTRSSKSPPPRRRASPAPRRAQDVSPPMHNTALILAGTKDLLTLVAVPDLVEGLVTSLPRGMHAHVQRVANLFPTMKGHRLDDSRGTTLGPQVDQIQGIDAAQRKAGTGNTGIEARIIMNAGAHRPNLSHRGSAV